MQKFNPERIYKEVDLKRRSIIYQKIEVSYQKYQDVIISNPCRGQGLQKPRINFGFQGKSIF
jgi:hypothetical protein